MRGSATRNVGAGRLKMTRTRMECTSKSKVGVALSGVSLPSKYKSGYGYKPAGRTG